MKKLILGIIIFIILAALSWGITCGLVYLISLCFKFEFSWAVGTGIWLISILVKAVFDGKKE